MQVTKQSEPAKCPIQRVFETDDLLGKIYSSISCAADRKAFRQCSSSTYRSPSINFHITRLVLRPETLALQETAEKVAAFPKHATIQAVDIFAQDIIMFYDSMSALRASTSARERLRSVKFVALMDCHLAVKGASKIADLFPSLRKLKVVFSTCYDGSMGVLAGLEELELQNVHLKAPGGFPSLAAFRSLKSLNMVLSSPLTTVRPLAAAFGLQSLTLSGYEIMADGLDCVLERVPLSYLSIEGLLFPSPTPRLRSSTLKILNLAINSSFPRLCPRDFPNLRLLTLAQIDMFGKDPEGAFASDMLGPDEEQLQGLEQVVTGLASGFPLEIPMASRAPISYESQSNNAYKTLVINCETGTCPASTYLALLRLLSKLPVLLGSVERLVVGDYKICGEGLNLTTRLFPHTEHVFLSGGFLGDKISDVLMMPRLQQMCLEVLTPPRDVISTLNLAMIAGKSLVLDLKCDGYWDIMLALKHQWDDMRAAVPAARRVVLRAS